MPSPPAHIAELPYRRSVAKTLLHVQVVVVEIGSLKVLVNPVNVKNRISAAWIGSDVTAGTQLDRVKNILARLPRVGSLTQRVLRINGHRAWTGWVVLYAGGVVRRTNVHKRIHVDLVKVDSESATHHQVFPVRRLVSKANTRREIFQ